MADSNRRTEYLIDNECGPILLAQALGCDYLEEFYDADLSANLTIADPPAITLQPLGGAACEGAALTLTVEATGAAPLTYQWSVPEQPTGSVAVPDDPTSVTPSLAGDGETRIPAASIASITFKTSCPAEAALMSINSVGPVSFGRGWWSMAAITAMLPNWSGSKPVRTSSEQSRRIAMS